MSALARRARRGGAILALLTMMAACGGTGGGPSERSRADGSDLHGVRLVVGSEADAWSLLAIPRAGGKATARDVRDPGHVLWTGSVDLPAASEAHALEGPAVVLRTDDGAVYRYDPLSDSLSRLGSVGAGARWSEWGSYGAFLDPEGSRVLEVGPDGAWRFRLSGSPAWVVPVEGGALAVLGADGGREGSVWLVSREDTAPARRSEAGYAAPGLTTAWGKRLVLTGRDRKSLRVLTVPALTSAEEVSLDGTLAALTASPSSHDVYAGLSGPPRIVSVNRFDRSSRVLAKLDAPVTDLRSAVLGSFLLGRQGGSVVWIPLAGKRTRVVGGDWRSDLPLGTPAGQVLLARGDSLLLWDPESGAPPAVADGPADARWLAVRWNPAPPSVRVARAGADTGEASSEEREAASAAGGAGATAGTGAGSAGAAGPGAATPPVAAEGGAAGTPPSSEPAAGEASAPATTGGGSPRARLQAGVYAVVASARDSSGVRSLLDDLSSAGYPTSMQRYTDDAGRTWYRGLVGPYPSRDAAESAARQLRRERDLRVWVTEIRPGSGVQGLLR